MPQLTLQQAFSLAVQHQQSGRTADAQRIYEQIVAADPQHAAAWHNLGLLAGQAGQYETAVDLLRKSIAIQPNSPQAHNNLGNALSGLGNHQAAIAAFQKAIQLNPSIASAHHNLANSLKANGALSEAAASYRRAISLMPDFQQAWHDLGTVLEELGELDAAIVAYRESIRLNPDDANAHVNLALALLLNGNFEEGWHEHEWRLKTAHLATRARHFSQPRWNGEALNGETVLLYTEQGYGDLLQFIRFAPLIEQCGGRAIVECLRDTKRLLEPMPGVSQWITAGDPLPHFDLQCPVMSLPFAMRGRPLTLPPIPYLRIEDSGQSWGINPTRINVALAWAGNPTFKGDGTRSMTLQQLAPLAAVQGVTFYSVQKGYAQSQLANPPPGLELIDLSPHLHDFADTADAMRQMDLVITTDTSVAHLVGALGQAVWLMLQYMPDWRWLRHRPDSLWYPTMRLFRQNARGNWPGVIHQVTSALVAFTGSKGEHPS